MSFPLPANLRHLSLQILTKLPKSPFLQADKSSMPFSAGNVRVTMDDTGKLGDNGTANAHE